MSKILRFNPKKESYVWVIKRNNGHNPYLVFTFLTSVLFKKKTCRLWFFCIFYDMQENLQAFIYIKISKIPVENPKKKLPECHCIGKRLKYPPVSRKIMKMPLAARVAHARLLLAAARFLSNRWSILVDLMSRILMVVVLTVVDG